MKRQITDSISENLTDSDLESSDFKLIKVNLSKIKRSWNRLWLKLDQLNWIAIKINSKQIINKIINNKFK